MYRYILHAFLCLAVLFSAGVVTAENRTEVVSMRSEYAKVFNNGNGTRTAEISTKPIHKQNLSGEWIEAGKAVNRIAKVADTYNPSNYNEYSVVYVEETEEYKTDPAYYGVVGADFQPGPPASDIFIRTAYLWYTAGIISPGADVSSVYYRLDDPDNDYNDVNIDRCPNNPRWATLATIFGDCYAENERNDVTSSTNLTYGSMESDVEDGIDNGWYAIGQKHPDEETAHPVFFMGTSATLYITYTESRRKAVPGSSVTISPNPFNPRTTIQFGLQNSSHVEITVYNITGQVVSQLVDNYLSAGTHSYTFDGSHLSSGMYFYRFATPNTQQTGKMLLTK